MPNIIGEEIPSYTIDEINRRQTIHGKGSNSSNQRSTEDLAYLNSQTSWVKLASGVSISEDKLKAMGIVDTTLSGMGLAKKNVLYGGVSSLTGDVNNQYLTPQSSNVNISGYEQTNTFGIVPKPGLENVSVKTLNRGSIKKSSIKLKVYNREQFEIIDALYLRLGYTVLLEWGNNKYIDDSGEIQNVGGTLVEDNIRFFNKSFEKNRSYLDLLGPINYYRNKYRGNYDGFLGKISNFSWSFNEDGSYDIDLTVISLGDVIESLKSNISITSNLVNLFKNSELFKQTEEEESNQTSYLTPYDNTNIITAMLWAWKFLNQRAIYNFTDASKTITIDNGDGIKGLVGLTLDLPSSLKIKTYILQIYEVNSSKILYSFEDSIFTDEAAIYQRIAGIRSKLISGEIPPTTYKLPSDKGRLVNSFALREFDFKWVESQTEIDGIFQSQFTLPSSVIRLNTPEIDHYIRFEYLLRFIQENVIPYIKTDTTTTSNTPLFNIDYNRYENIMYTLPNQISLDPRVCVVRNDSFQTQYPNRQAQVFPELLPFRASDNYSVLLPSIFKPNPNKAYPMNIYLNFKFVVDSLNSNTDERGDVGLFGFISSICTGLNKALGGVNNLEPIIDTDTNTLKIIDSTPIPDVADNKGEYTLEIFGYNNTKSNFIRKVDLKTAITPEYATMVTVGATAGGYVKGTEATAFSNWNKGLTDRFNTELTTQNNNNNPTSSIDEAELNYVEQYLSLYNKKYGFLTTNAWQNNNIIQLKFVDDAISSNLSIVTEYYKYIQNKNRAGGAIGFIPFKFNFVMDGLSGFKIYNKLHISTRFLPRNYSDTLNFLVTGITHDLNDNDWETSIQTTVIPKTTKIEDLNIDENLILTSIANVNNANSNISTTGAQESIANVNNPESTVPSSPNQGGINKLKNSTSNSDTPLLKNAVEDQANYMYDKVSYKGTVGERTGICAGYTFNIAQNIKQHIDQQSQQAIPITYKTSGNANTNAHRSAIDRLGLYERIYLGSFTATELRSSTSIIKTTQWNVGDILNYYAPGFSGASNMHSQIYTGDIFQTSTYTTSGGVTKTRSNSGWSTSTKTNYGGSFIYPSSNKVFKVFAFKVKKEYLK